MPRRSLHASVIQLDDGQTIEYTKKGDEERASRDLLRVMGNDLVWQLALLWVLPWSTYPKTSFAIAFLAPYVAARFTR